MADVRLVVIDVDELQRLIMDAVRAASPARSAADDWVDARSSGLGRRTFLRLAREGAFPASRRGKTYVARRTDVDAYLERQRIAPTPLPSSPDPPRLPAGALFDPIAAALGRAACASSRSLHESRPYAPRLFERPGFGQGLKQACRPRGLGFAGFRPSFPAGSADRTTSQACRIRPG